MAWCRQAPIHYPNQRWPRSMSPYGITWLQWGNQSLYIMPTMKFVFKFAWQVLSICLNGWPIVKLIQLSLQQVNSNCLDNWPICHMDPGQNIQNFAPNCFKSIFLTVNFCFVLFFPFWFKLCNNQRFWNCGILPRIPIRIQKGLIRYLQPVSWGHILKFSTSMIGPIPKALDP